MSDNKDDKFKTPHWVWILILALAALQPTVHLLIKYAPPEGTVPTGLHIPDSALFLQSMDMFNNDFYSPYATCQAGAGDHSITYYAVPHLWLYGALGWITHPLPIDPFLCYGFANGLGALFYLWMVYRLLITLVPRYANAAFVLFTLSGGPGGVLYLLSGWAGIHHHPDFETYFFRFAVYDLMEGPHLNPVLYFPRLYYTLSLALCLGGFNALLRTAEDGRVRRLLLWSFPITLGSFINARFAMFTMGLVGLCVLFGSAEHRTKRFKLALWYAASALPGLIIAYKLMQLNPAVIENHLQVGNMAMWFSPFLVVAWLHLLIILWLFRRHMPVWPAASRILACTLLGYLAAFALFYLLHQLYYGNLALGRDGAVAAAISDYALIGIPVSLLLQWRLSKNTQTHTVHTHTPWIMIWLLTYLAVSLSGWGQGWFLKFGPQRLQVFLWLPLCILVASELHYMRSRTLNALLWILLIGFGATSVFVAAFMFQGPVGRPNAQGPYAQYHTEIMSEANAKKIQTLNEGTVAAPLPYGDIIVRQRNLPVLFGIGSFNLTDLHYTELKAINNRLLNPETSPEEQQKIKEKWKIHTIFSPE